MFKRTPDPEEEINFARALLGGQSAGDLSDEEIMQRAEELLSDWMNGELRMERPKLYDHYALVLAALLRKVQQLEARVSELELR